LTAGLRSSLETAETGVSTTESVRPKTKANRSLYVGDERNRSWSCGERIRLVGLLKLRVERSSGDGKSGVSGTGCGFAVGGCRRRGCSFGKRSRRSSIPAVDRSFPIVELSVLEGILALMVFGEGGVACQGSTTNIEGGGGTGRDLPAL
jgi:hypothetical protein